MTTYAGTFVVTNTATGAIISSSTISASAYPFGTAISATSGCSGVTVYAAPANDANSITADALIRNVAITDNTVYQKYPTGTLSSYVPSTKPATYPASAIPQGLAIDIYGSLYYAMYSGSTGTFVSKVLDGTGVANAFVASVGGPFAVAIGGLWNVYIGETYGSQTGPSTYMPGKITKCTYSSSTYTCAAIGVISTATASNPYWYS